MRILYLLKKNSSYYTILCLTILYALFLSVNPVGDAYSNAYSSLYAEDMLKPHHLLYCLYGNLILKIFGFLHLEPMIILQLSNTVVAGGCLLVLRRIIKSKEIFSLLFLLLAKKLRISSFTALVKKLR